MRSLPLADLPEVTATCAVILGCLLQEHHRELLMNRTGVKHPLPE